MKRYDIYVYEPGSDIIVCWHKFEADDSKAAFEIVQSLGLSGRLELWKNYEILKRWDAP